MFHVETQLLAYLDGELSPTEVKAVEAHLSRCQSCTARLAELEALRTGLAEVIPATYQAVRMPAAVEARIRRALVAERARQARGGAWQRLRENLLLGLRALAGPLSQAAAPVAAAIFLILTIYALRLPVQTGVQETLVLGQDTFVPGTKAALRVLVREEESAQPVANADITVRLRHAGLAKTLYQGRTDATGSAPVRFAVPAEWEGQAELEVEARSPLGSNHLVEPIRLARSYRLLLSSDKPVYQPGEIIHLRTLALGVVDGRPAAGARVHFQVLDPDGRLLLDQEVVSSEFGIAAADLNLGQEAALGQYQLRAVLGDTVSELSVQVSRAELPAFRVDVEADAPYYLAGQPLSGQVSARYFFGKPLAHAAVQVRLVAYRGEPSGVAATDRLFELELAGETNEEGIFSFRFQLPDLPATVFEATDTLPLDLEATVTEPVNTATAGLPRHSEFGWQRLTLARQPILIDVVAEGGTLRAGVENVLYVLTSYPDGQPASTSLSVRIGDGPLLQEHSSEFGLAQIRYTPRAAAAGSRQIQVTASDQAGRVGTAAITLPLNQVREALLLRTDRAVYRVGETLALEVLASGAGPAVYLDVVKGGQTLLTLSAPVKDGRATLAIDLTPDLAGTLELTAYQVTADGSALRDTRVVVVDQPEGLQVRLATDRATYRPGQAAQVTVETLREGQQVQAAVGLAAVNEAVFAQREFRPGFARLYFILDKALRESGVRLPDPAQPPAVQAQELRAAQQQAAKASWAGYQGRGFKLAARAADTATRERVNQARTRTLRRLGLDLSLMAGLLPLLLAAVVIGGLRPSGVLGAAVGRSLLTLVVLAVAGGVLLVGLQRLLGALPAGWGLAWLAMVALLWLLALIGLAVYGWRWRDARAQHVVLLLLAYAICLALLAQVTEQGAVLGGLAVALLALAFAVLLAALLFYGWGLREEGETRAGAVTLLLALLVLVLAASLATANLPGMSLIDRVTGPTVDGLSGGLLTACAAPAAVPRPAEQPAAPAAEKAEAPGAQPKALQLQPAPTEVPPKVVEPVQKVEETVVVAREEGLAPTATVGQPAALIPPATEVSPVDVEETEAALAEKPVAEVPPAPPALALVSPVETPTPTPVAARALQVASPTAPPPTPTPTPLSTPVPPAAPAAAVTPTPLPMPAEGVESGGGPAVTPTPLSPEALPIIRQRFPQTLYWSPELLTDENGFLQVEIPTGDSITTWRLTALAVSRDGALGSAVTPLTVFQPLFLQPQAPATLRVGEQATVLVQIFNYSSQSRTVRLSAQPSAGLEVLVADRPSVLTANEAALTTLTVRALTAGEQTLTLTAQDDKGEQDARRVTIAVQP